MKRICVFDAHCDTISRCWRDYEGLDRNTGMISLERTASFARYCQFFALWTADGYTGSYRVIQMEEVVSRCLENPDHYLSGGCTAPDILATDDSTQIRTLQSGTAIFENGCWRMIRKSKIVYE